MPETKTDVGSYFISNYPPFSQWSKEAVGEAAAALSAPPVGEAPLGLYLHLPFCRKRCKFCYFKVFTDKNGQEVERYLAALSKEIELVSQQPVMGDRPFRFVYFGGGTPSFLSSRQLTRLVDRLRANIDWSLAEEVTFECEPGTLSEAKVGTLREIGVTRLSLGVEHFDDKILRDNGRAHESMEIDRAWPWITAAGFDNVNIDLIAGMVGDTTDKWQDAVKRAVDMAPESVTIYQMELPYNTVISQGVLAGEESPIASWEQKREWVSWAFDRFLAAGQRPGGQDQPGLSLCGQARRLTHIPRERLGQVFHDVGETRLSGQRQHTGAITQRGLIPVSLVDIAQRADRRLKGAGSTGLIAHRSKTRRDMGTRQRAFDPTQTLIMHVAQARAIRFALAGQDIKRIGRGPRFKAVTGISRPARIDVIVIA